MSQSSGFALTDFEILHNKCVPFTAIVASKKQTNKQTNNPTNKQTNKQPNKQTNTKEKTSKGYESFTKLVTKNILLFLYADTESPVFDNQEVDVSKSDKLH